MADIKIKEKQEINIKKLDRATIIGQNLKSNIVNVKDKTKENYEKNEDTAQEYAGNKVESQIKSATYYGIRKANQIGKKSLKRTTNNLKNAKENVKKVKETIKKARKTGKETIKTVKRTVKTAKNTIKTAKRTVKTTEKTAKQVAKTSIKLAQRTAQMTKIAIKTTIQAIKIAIKTAIAIIKAIILATKALISAIIAGGWVAVVVIIVICLIAMICTSIYGIFFSNEKDVGDKTMSSVIREINTEFTNKITEIQTNTEHDEYEINSNRAEWKDILSLYAVVVSNGEEQTDVITLDDKKINKLKEIFWQMNTITSRVDEIEKDIEVTDENGNTKTEKKRIKMLHIEITNKSLQEMIDLYNLNAKQKEQLAELQKNEYNSMWSYVLYGSSAGSNDIVQIALSQIGNKGRTTLLELVWLFF